MVLGVGDGSVLGAADDDDSRKGRVRRQSILAGL